jgi:hypothetical protein
VATTYKVLGQAAPAANTPSNIYTVPAFKQTVVSSIVVANRASEGTTFRVSVRPAGASAANQHYLAYDVPIARNTSTVLSFGVTLSETDVITVESASADVSFSVFGSEIQ